MTTVSTSTAQTLLSSTSNTTSAIKSEIASLEASISSQEEALSSASTDEEETEINEALTELRAERAVAEAKLAQLKSTSEPTPNDPAETLLSGESETIGTSNLSENVEDTPFGERTAYV